MFKVGDIIAIKYDPIHKLFPIEKKTMVVIKTDKEYTKLISLTEAITLNNSSHATPSLFFENIRLINKSMIWVDVGSRKQGTYIRVEAIVISSDEYSSVSMQGKMNEKFIIKTNEIIKKQIISNMIRIDEINQPVIYSDDKT